MNIELVTKMFLFLKKSKGIPLPLIIRAYVDPFESLIEDENFFTQYFAFSYMQRNKFFLFLSYKSSESVIKFLEILRRKMAVSSSLRDHLNAALNASVKNFPLHVNYDLIRYIEEQVKDEENDQDIFSERLYNMYFDLYTNYTETVVQNTILTYNIFLKYYHGNVDDLLLVAMEWAEKDQYELLDILFKDNKNFKYQEGFIEMSFDVLLDRYKVANLVKNSNTEILDFLPRILIRYPKLIPVFEKVKDHKKKITTNYYNEVVADRVQELINHAFK